jgi:hypothetical protein
MGIIFEILLVAMVLTLCFKLLTHSFKNYKKIQKMSSADVLNHRRKP